MSYTVGILLAAGSGERMGCNKLLLPFAGETALQRSFEVLSRAVNEIVIAVSEGTRNNAEALKGSASIPVTVVMGGKTRQESVLFALRAVKKADVAAVHDAARCLVSPALIRSVIESAADAGSGVPVLPVRDTVRTADGKIVDRSNLLMVQTPQAFRFSELLPAYEAADKAGFSGTDDCSVYEFAGYTPTLVSGELMNQKLTYPTDLPFFSQALGAFRIGYGEDTHRIKRGRKLILGGVEIDSLFGLDGHSDADALTHAVIDALFGAAALGDIGKHFPDTDERYRGANSLTLLKSAYNMVQSAGYRVGNVDATILAQEPKLSPYVENMRENLARVLCVPVSVVSVKATTPEHIGPEGRLESITVHCAAMLQAE